MFVLLLTTVAVFNFDWGADFWEHATILRSFSQNLWSTHNPIITHNDIHAFQTPNLEKEIKNPKYKLLLCLFLSVFLLTNKYLLKETINIIKPKDRNRFQYNQMQFLRKYIAKDDIVLSDSSNFIIPAFAGKVVYSPFLKVSLIQSIDYQKREQDVMTFFDIQIKDSIRQEIIKKNAIKYILLKKGSFKPEISDFCSHYATVVYSDDLWYLYKIN